VLYETWNKPIKAKEWRAKLPRAEAVREWHNLKNGVIFLVYNNVKFP